MYKTSFVIPIFWQESAANFWEISFLPNKPFSVSSVFCFKLNAPWLFGKMWSFIFAYQKEPPWRVPSTFSDLSCLKMYFKRSLQFSYACSGTSKPNIPRQQVKLSESIKVNIPSTSVSRFSTLVAVDVTGWSFNPLSLATYIKP